MKQIAIHDVGADSADLQQLIAELDQYLTGLYPLDEIFTVDFQSPELEKFHFAVAYIEGEAVGCGAVHLLSDSAVELKRFFVRPTYRRQGVAACLLAALEKRARELGASAVLLETGEPQAEAVHFYRKHGYRDIERFGEYADCPSSLCMEKRFNYMEKTAHL